MQSYRSKPHSRGLLLRNINLRRFILQVFLALFLRMPSTQDVNDQPNTSAYFH